MLVRSENDVKNFLEHVAETFEKGMEYTAEFELKKFDRSLAQNRLAFKWYDELGSPTMTGHGKGYERAICKWHIGFPILLGAEKNEAITKLYDLLVTTMTYEEILQLVEEQVDVTKMMTRK